MTTTEKPLKIVIADDEGVIRMGLRAMVQSLGHQVVATARNGEEAIEKVKQLTPDLLLLDIKMPRMDGLTAARILATEAPLPIVLLTAFGQRDLVQEAVDALVMGYLVKPVDERKLAPALDMAVTNFAALTDTAGTVERLKGEMVNRDLVNRARQVLMAQGHTEDQAYHQLQAGARKRQISLARYAQLVIKVGDEV